MHPSILNSEETLWPALANEVWAAMTCVPSRQKLEAEKCWEAPKLNIWVTNLCLLRKVNQRGGKRIRRIWCLRSQKERVFFKKERVMQCQGCSELKKDEIKKSPLGWAAWRSPGAFATASCYQNGEVPHSVPAGCRTRTWVRPASLQEGQSLCISPADRVSRTFTNTLPVLPSSVSCPLSPPSAEVKKKV